MLSAPAAIPAMIEVSFPAGFTPAEATRVSDANRDLLVEQLREPGLLGQPITGTRPAHDTRFSSSNSGVASRPGMR